MTENNVLKNGNDLISNANAVYLTTINSNGYPATRAMLNLRNPKQFPKLADFFKQKDEKEIYFTTNTSSSKIKEIRENNNVSVYFCDPRSWHGLMYQGAIEIIEDTSIKNALWQDNWVMYYPEGKDSEDYAVLRLIPKHIRSYYKFNQEQIDL